MEEVLARHRKEQRELQSRITQKKKSATKKTRKGVNDECDALQRQLQDRQQAELDARDSESVADGIEDLEIDSHSGEHWKEETGRSKRDDEFEDEKIVDDESESVASASNEPRPQKKPNRQKARLARRAAEQEAQAAQAAEEAANLPDLREQEMSAMRQHMEKHRLKEISIRPDGHCLYSAIATVLPAGQTTTSPSVQPYQAVRTTAASFISEHPDDFEAFLEEPLAAYVGKIKDTAEWGGQLELQAIARAYAVQVNVLQADGRVEKIESETGSKDDPVWLAYYRHSFGLGAHYNALKKAD